MKLDKKIKNKKNLELTLLILNKLNINFSLKNEITGQININTDKGLIVYYSNTEKILLNNHSLENKGIIELLKFIM